MSQELIYLLLIFSLMVIPRALQRFKLPAPVTCLWFGIGAMLMWPDRVHDSVVILLSTLGISSLFLFAGMEVDLGALRRNFMRLMLHLAIRIAVLMSVAWVGVTYFSLSWQAAALVSLALLTPSTGFILDTLQRMGLNEDERFWVTSKAISGELLALAALFVVLQADDMTQLATSSGAMLLMIVCLPLFFVAMGRWVVPHAHGSEFSLLVMVGMVAAFITYKLGVYYLVGAFVAGLVARLLRARMPSLASEDNLHALRLFATFFVPFYFFHAGMTVPAAALSVDALIVGLLLTAAVLPMRILVVCVQRRYFFDEDWRSAFRVSLALAPTLVFTLVLVTILQARFPISDALLGGLLLYTMINTILPSLVLKQPFDVDPMDDRIEHATSDVEMATVPSVSDGQASRGTE